MLKKLLSSMNAKSHLTGPYTAGFPKNLFVYHNSTVTPFQNLHLDLCVTLL